MSLSLKASCGCTLQVWGSTRYALSCHYGTFLLKISLISIDEFLQGWLLLRWLFEFWIRGFQWLKRLLRVTIFCSRRYLFLFVTFRSVLIRLLRIIYSWGLRSTRLHLFLLDFNTILNYNWRSSRTFKIKTVNYRSLLWRLWNYNCEYLWY